MSVKKKLVKANYGRVYDKEEYNYLFNTRMSDFYRV